jgi:hypothetical protein
MQFEPSPPIQYSRSCYLAFGPQTSLADFVQEVFWRETEETTVWEGKFTVCYSWLHMLGSSACTCSG